MGGTAPGSPLVASWASMSSAGAGRAGAGASRGGLADRLFYPWLPRTSLTAVPCHI